MTTQTRPIFRLRACQRCGGDAYLTIGDEPEWHCLQCARMVPPETATEPQAMPATAAHAA